MKSYNLLLDYTNKNYRNYIFIVVFYSLWLLCKYASPFSTELQSFPGRMIGEATLQGYDINKRISAFYQAGAIFFFAIILFLIILWRVAPLMREFLSSSEFKIINYSSLAGITFYFFNLWSGNFDSSLELIYCIHKVAIAGLILKWLLLKEKSQSTQIGLSFYAVAFVLGVSVFFVLNELAVLFGFPKADFLITLFCSVIAVLFIVITKLNKKLIQESGIWLNKCFLLLIPLACIPVLSFFKDEIYLILNRHQVYYLSPRKLYLLALLSIVGVVFLRYRKIQKRKFKNFKSNEQLVALYYLPLLIVSLATYTFYSPFTEISNEMFEAGNRFLPLMEFQQFGVVPVFEKFNSHVLSELFFGGIYAFFNGLHSREMYIYEFMYQVFWAFIAYRFMYKVSRNAYIALFIVLLFPLIDSLLFDYTIIALLAVFVTNKIINEKPSLKNYLLLISCFSFLVLWRIDIGYPAIIAGCGTLLVYRINCAQFAINWKLVFKAFAVFAGVILAGLLIISWWRNINVFEKLWSGLNYLASAQTYGLINMGDASQSAYKIQYFVFPVILILGLGAILLFFKRLNVSRSQRFIYSAFLFLAIYYCVNFQRGLVRHSFVEGHDNGVSSFIFFLFSGSVFLFCYNRSKVFKFIGFLVLATFLLMNYKFPAPTEFKNLYSKTMEKAAHFSAIDTRPDIIRCIDNTNYEETYYKEFKKLIARHLGEKQTFIDFSNKPMLYYFTGKISPSYFYQNPLTIHNEYLQKKFIEDLKEYDAPLIVFSAFPETWWDNVDGVANTMRHYRMAEYFYQHYQPFVIVDKMCIWKRKDFNLSINEQVIYSYTRNADSLETQSDVIRQTIKAPEEKKHLLKIYWNENVPEITLNTKKKSVSVKADFSSTIDHSAYYILEAAETEFSFELKNNNNIRSVQLTGNEFIPDFYSAYPQNDDLQKLPAIWATYDAALKEEKTITVLAADPITMSENQIRYFNFNNTIDKSTGNTLLISLEADNEEPQPIELMYGSSKNSFKGLFKFILPLGKGSRDFAVRVSSQYNWFDPNIDYIGLLSKAPGITIKRVALLKAE